MANEFLMRKWKACFQANDVNKDGVLTMEDAELFTDRFAAHHKFDVKQTTELKEKFRYFWKKFLLRGLDKMTEEMYIANLRDEYNAGYDKFRENIKKFVEIIDDIFDVNKDGFLSENELEASLEAWGIRTLDRTYIQMYPKHRQGLLKMTDFNESWTEFFCNDDESDISKEKAPMYGLRMIDS